jgi:N-acetylneuraminate synthase
LLQEKFGVKCGLSDHTLGVGVAIAAVVLGATAIEKHITLRRSDGGADGAFSMEPEEFELMVKESTAAIQSLGKKEWQIQESEMESRRLRRSLYIVEDVKHGDLVSSRNVKAIRPGAGISPANFNAIKGKTFASDLRRGTPLANEHLE